jgi:replicative DNA helicase
LINIAQSQRPIPTIFFQLELSPEPMCERFIARTIGTDTLHVEQATQRGEEFDVSLWDHVFICPKSKVSLEDMESIINQAELKMRKRPVLILVDYVGLMGGGGNGKRYERLSTIAEGLKTLARSTETVIIMASQIRRDPERVEVDLHDAKDSGSVENSAQLVMGAWRPSPETMTIKILKQTKRAGQVKIDCTFDGNKQTIRELYAYQGDK